MKRLAYNLLLSSILLAPQFAGAQAISDAAMQTDNTYARIRQNPAYTPVFDNTITATPLGNLSVSVLTPTSVSSVMQRGSDGKTYMSIDKLLTGLKGRALALDLDLSLLSYALKTKVGTFNAAFSLRTVGAMSVDKELIELLRNGNSPASTVQSKGLQAGLTHYNELAFGYSRQNLFIEGLDLGARVKFLFGILNTKVMQSEFTVKTSASADRLDIGTEQDIVISAPVTIERQPSGEVDISKDIRLNSGVGAGDFLFGSNFGLGLDFGAIYKINESWIVGASITDLGFITWTKAPHRLTKNNSTTWRGSNISKDLSGQPEGENTDKSETQDLEDLFSGNYRLQTGKSYTTGLTARLRAEASYRVLPWLQVGSALTAYCTPAGVIGGFTLLGTATPVRLFSGSLSYSVINGGWANIGMAVSVGEKVRFMLATNNIIAANYTSARAMSFQMGLSVGF